jgi:hypothetical protein
MSLKLTAGERRGNTLTMQICGPTSLIIETRSSGEVTSIETHRFVFLDVITERRRLTRGFWVVDARDS